MTGLLAPYWKSLAVAFGAMLISGAAALLEPWPLKIVFDHVIGSKAPPAWLVGWVRSENDTPVLLAAAAVAVVTIAIIGAASSYLQRYLSTTVGMQVGTRPAPPGVSPCAAAVAFVLRTAADGRHGRPPHDRYRGDRDLHYLGSAWNRARRDHDRGHFDRDVLARLEIQSHRPVDCSYSVRSCHPPLTQNQDCGARGEKKGR